MLAVDATDEQLDFQFIYASAKQGWAVDDFAAMPAEGEEVLMPRSRRARAHPPRIRQPAPWQNRRRVRSWICHGAVHASCTLPLHYALLRGITGGGRAGRGGHGLAARRHRRRRAA
jgi:hypothetical protein